MKEFNYGCADAECGGVVTLAFHNDQVNEVEIPDSIACQKCCREYCTRQNYEAMIVRRLAKRRQMLKDLGLARPTIDIRLEVDTSKLKIPVFDLNAFLENQRKFVKNLEKNRAGLTIDEGYVMTLKHPEIGSFWQNDWDARAMVLVAEDGSVSYTWVTSFMVGMIDELPLADFHKHFKPAEGIPVWTVVPKAGG